jgi:acid phosphatase
VANKTGYVNANKVNTQNLYFNRSYPGPVSDSLYIDACPVPNTTAMCASGMDVFPSIKQTWGRFTGTYNYTNMYPYDDSSDNNKGDSPVIGSLVSGAPTTGTTGTSQTSATNSGGASTKSSKGLSSATKIGIGLGVPLGIIIFALIMVGVYFSLASSVDRNCRIEVVKHSSSHSCRFMKLETRNGKAVKCLR